MRCGRWRLHWKPLGETLEGTCRALPVRNTSHCGSRQSLVVQEKGHYVIAVDWKRNEYFEESQFCDEFKLLDLRTLENCLKATEGCEWCFNLAADMGGMGFIQSNHSLILYNNTMISFNMAEAARQAGVKRMFYASSACIYPEGKQVTTHSDDQAAGGWGLKESDAWPAEPQDAYGLEKLVSEELCKHYGQDIAEMEFRVARFHNIYGPQGTWKGGREKAPAAFCRKAAANDEIFEIWGDGKQTRSFCFVDDAVEVRCCVAIVEIPTVSRESFSSMPCAVQGVWRLFQSDFTQPMNIGSEEMISMNDMADLAMNIAGKKLERKNIPGPEGVRGRNSDNNLIRQVPSQAVPLSVSTTVSRLCCVSGVGMGAKHQAR